MIPSSSGHRHLSGQAETIAGQSGPGPHRSLSDDVLPSAKDELWLGGAVDDAGPSGRTQGPHASTFSRDSTSGATRRGLGYFSRMPSQLTNYVKGKPGTAAMMAAGAGALLALLLGKRGKNRH